MDITRIDRRTAATESSWYRALALGGVVLVVWFTLHLIGTVALPDRTSVPPLVLALAFGAALELDRRNRARRRGPAA